ncbi:unnamed protein product, partial [Brugia pahangi]|uniref:Uncharacterized protein n=1 Tax=Brugia pahangi TaxID=6280 RepID=A0A0N4TVR8_BRUPA
MDKPSAQFRCLLINICVSNTLHSKKYSTTANYYGQENLFDKFSSCFKNNV